MKSWFVEKLGDRYKVLSGWKTVDLIDKALKKHSNGLTTQQRRDLINEFGDSGLCGNLEMPFIAYAWEEEKPTGKNVWRLTAPFFFVYALIVIGIVSPIKWLITGKYYFSQKSKINIFNIGWYNKIFDRRWNQ
jgi:hypothetical protein